MVLEKILAFVGRQESWTRGDRAAYRVYRAGTILEMGPNGDSNWDRSHGAFHTPPEAGAPAAPRDRIDAFRNVVYHNHLRDRNARPRDPKLVAQALRIPPTLPVYPSIFNVLGFCLLGALLPEGRRVAIASKLLRAVGTELGRHHIYAKLICHLVGRRGEHGSFENYLSDGLQFALLNLDGFESQAQLHALARAPIDLMKASLRLGICAPPQIEQALAPIERSVNAKAVLILADEAVLTADFSAIFPHLDPEKMRWVSDSHPDDEEFLKTVRILKAAQVPHVSIVGLLSSRRRLDSDRLKNIIDFLRVNGIFDIPTVFDGLGPRLWSIEYGVLQFALTHLKVSDAPLLVRFAPLLAEHAPPNPVVAKALFALGATSADLVECQTFLVESSKISQPQVERLEVLMKSPYFLGFKELNGCTPYLRRNYGEDDRFRAFLAVLAAHDLDHKEAIRCFSRCFESISNLDSLDLRLRIARNHLPSLEVAPLAQWLRYLCVTSGMLAASVEALDKAVELSRVSPNVLKFLVDERGLNTIARLHRWYYDEGTGVVTYSGGDECDSTDRLLFTDCGRRKSFYRLHDNVAALVDACWNHAQRLLGSMNLKWTDAERWAYFDKRQQEIAAAKVQAAMFIQQILDATDGTLLRSMLDVGLAGGDLTASLQLLKPAMVNLVQGNGPTSENLTPLDVDCISLVYGASPSTIHQHWHNVRGYEGHLSALSFDARYRVELRRQHFKLMLASPAHEKAFEENLHTLAAAAAMAREMDGKPLLDAAQDLSWKHRKNNAATPKELWQWFAFVLRLGATSETVRSWTDRKLEAMGAVLAQPDFAKARFEEFEQFIRVTLPDAVGPIAIALHELGGAEGLGRNLKPMRHADDPAAELAFLEAAITEMVTAVIKAYTRWVVSVKRQFERKKGDDILEATVVVSKHPAAFYARDAFELCSSDDTGMWSEQRHSHLLIFDEERQRLIGMAMLYIQPIPGFFRGQACLVVRALNTRPIDDVQLEPVSVIDEVMRIAIKIAQDNGLASVLFPQSSTYFSNQRDIERAVDMANTTRRAQRLSATHPIFYCRGHGAQDGAVHALFMVWAGPTKPGNFEANPARQW
jgi:hypothetical protein